jgi:hypothetical protein
MIVNPDPKIGDDSDAARPRSRHGAGTPLIAGSAPAEAADTNDANAETALAERNPDASSSYLTLSNDKLFQGVDLPGSLLR